jgi:CheY-like chemotaxis protein
MTIDHTHPILMVDDDEFMLAFMEETLGQHYPVRIANHPETALAMMRVQQPALLLADVRMPGMDGFTLCETIKADPVLAEVPVLFLSALDGVDEHVRGYEVGAEDFVTKPVEPQVLLAKVERVLQSVAERRQLRDQAGYAASTAMVAMSSMSETGMLIDALKRFNHCADYPSLARAVLASLQAFEVDGVVQLLPPDAAPLALASHGQASALEISVLHHMAGMERIMQFKTRLSISYPRLRLMVSNMPLHDEARCGRLRDHLAVLAESAEVRLDALQHEQQSKRQGCAISDTVAQLGRVLGDIDRMQRQGRADATLHLNTVLGRVEAALLGMGLTQRQEESVVTMIRDGFDELALGRLAEEHFQNALTRAIGDLQSVLDGPQTAASA